MSLNYCTSRYNTLRRKTREVMIGSVGVGANNPIRIQSMTNTLTPDVDATVKQAIALAEAGCEIIRATAPNVKAAAALKEIRKKLNEAKVFTPLVADIHFLPNAAMEAVEHVEKVRVNPGNYADKKKFAVLEYTDAQYQEELDRLHEAFSPLVKRSKELGRAMRIGTNHGSLSDRIMNRYGDSPLGMVESALEFVRIAESHTYQDIILSFKASNPKVMIEAYRLAALKMAEEGMDYPLHLGVTEAGDGEDGRIKSTIGIGSLLYDGLGDTIRVSLTEDPVYEVPVAKDLARRASLLWNEETEAQHDSIDPFSYSRRKTNAVRINDNIELSDNQPPRVIVKTHLPITDTAGIIKQVCDTQTQMGDSKLEGLLLSIQSEEDFVSAFKIAKALAKTLDFFALEINPAIHWKHVKTLNFPQETRWLLSRRFEAQESKLLEVIAQDCAANQWLLAIDGNASTLDALASTLKILPQEHLLYTLSQPEADKHIVGSYRALAECLKKHALKGPLWIRNTLENAIKPEDFFTARLIEASLLSGGLMCDGLGDLISIETEPLMPKATALAYNILQGARLRISKTEFVACPSCGRTLFDLESTTQKIKAKTGHLKGVTIAVMGCIVNGPGEMADADFGYVGGAPKKVNLYKGKECVKYHVPEDEAVEELINLIKENNKWVEPKEKATTLTV
tara:strand:- start:2359 stop:4398 length:2040 start_codon:yes stop_codon:yes gene_type:complete